MRKLEQKGVDVAALAPAAGADPFANFEAGFERLPGADDDADAFDGTAAGVNLVE